MQNTSSIDTFKEELTGLVEKFDRNLKEYLTPTYHEARVRQDFIDPFFAALGWDIQNSQSLIQSEREVEIESPTRISGSKKRADYLFRCNGYDRFVCEAKKPKEVLGEKYIFQAKRYAWNKDLPIALLSDFEELKIYVVSARPDSEVPAQGEFRVLHYKTYLKEADFLFNLLSRKSVADGSIETLIDSLPKRAKGKGKLKQGFLIRPDRTKTLDEEFLVFLDDARKDLASSLIKNNRSKLPDESLLNEASQKILDRILFLRICEDRDIDTGIKLISLIDLEKSAVSKEHSFFQPSITNTNRQYSSSPFSI